MPRTLLRRLSLLWFPVIAAIALTLSGVSLIIVFAVEASWFHDGYNGTSRYGLWRVCFSTFPCDSWFSTNSNTSQLVDGRFSGQGRAGTNAWQALEIIFLFLTTVTWIILIIALICYRIRYRFHYYLAILTVFCVWPTVCIGIAALFVFGFAVFNISQSPRDLDWCFYVNLTAVILVVISAILLSIYDILLRRPNKNIEDDAVIETFADLHRYPAELSPSTFVIVRRNKKKRNKPYDYPQILYPNVPYPTATTTTTTVNDTVTNERANANYITNTNRPIVTPYTSVVTTNEINTHFSQQPQLTSHRAFEYNRPDLVASSSITTMGRQPPSPIQTQSYRTAVPTYRYPSDSSPPSRWHRTTNNLTHQSTGYVPESSNNYLQSTPYYPSRSNPIDRKFGHKQEPRVLHYYTGYDYFATIDPSDTVVTRHNPPATALRYSSTTPYYHSNDYIKSTM